mmetsp:Transcript_26129/g.59488  ORF Transcript_26129/g.59488 Transcript_26129/m.59488 type:complete len:127 (-) Transcript_26129:104-484(-)
MDIRTTPDLARVRRDLDMDVPMLHDERIDAVPMQRNEAPRAAPAGIQCVLAMVLVAGALGFLNFVGFALRSTGCCPSGEGYTRCEVLQDFRSMLSFILGALLCCILTRESKQPEGSGKVQLYTCLL